MHQLARWARVSKLAADKGPADRVLFDHFISASMTTKEIGANNWLRASASGGLNQVPEVGHPGVIEIYTGAVASGFAAMYLGRTSSLPWCSLGPGQNEISCEFLVKLTSSVASGDVGLMQFGWGNSFHQALTNNYGVYVEFDPSADSHFRLRTARFGIRSASAGTTVPVADTWYRVGIRVTYPEGVPTAQLIVDGVAEGSTLVDNFPLENLGFGIKNVVGTNLFDSRLLVDSVSIVQVPNA